MNAKENTLALVIFSLPLIKEHVLDKTCSQKTTIS